MKFVNSSSTNLSIADLSGADVRYAMFDDKTSLPDRTTWTPDIAMTRFTNPAHPNIWLSNDRISPVYRGKETLE